jgi:TRAP-type mannitol/chloroaromatic compound transport system substrate-binding protein
MAILPRLVIAAIVGTLGWLVGTGDLWAQAEKRVALVIGNGDYRNASRLINPRNDAEDVAAALRRNGFETIVGLDLDKAGMEDATIRFSRNAQNADVALFYYSGHAIQHAGVNFLMPVDARLADEADLRRLTRVDDIVSDLKRARNLRILVLDACRDNPLADQLKRSIGQTRSAAIARGLAQIETTQGMIVSYATQAGRTADDGQGRNSPYTSAFLKHIETPDEIGTIFRRISTDVYTATRQTQLPELSLSLIGEFYLRARTGGAPSADPDAAALRDYEFAERIGTRAAYETFLQRHPGGFYADLARGHRDKLAALDPRPQPQPAPPQPQPPQPGGAALNWRLTSSYPKSIATSVEPFAQRLNALSGDRLKLSVFAAGEIVPGLQVFDAVSAGTVEMGYTPAQYYFGKDPAFQYLSGVPFGFEPHQHVAWRKRADVKAIVERLYARYNLVGMPCGAFARLEEFWSGKPIGSPADLDGFKLRVGGWAGMIFAKAGTLPVQISAGEIYPMLQSKRLDGVLWLAPRSGEMLGFNKVANHYYYPGVVMPSQVIDLIVNKTAWGKLRQEDRETVETTCTEATEKMLHDSGVNDAASVANLKRSGTIVAPLPAAVQKKLYELHREILSEQARNSEVLRALVAIVEGLTSSTVAANIK